MKNIIKISLLFYFLFSIDKVKSQDYIYKPDGSKIECTVEGIDSNNITYSQSSKTQSMNMNQASLIFLANGQYLTLPSTNTKLVIARSLKNLANDVVITKYAEALEGNIRALSKTEIEIFISPGNNATKIKGDEALLAIYKNGEHVFFKNPVEVITFLEYVQPEVIRIAEKNVADKQPISTPQNRPAHLQTEPERTVVATASRFEENVVSSSSNMSANSTLGSERSQSSNSAMPPQITYTLEKVTEPIRIEPAESRNAPTSTFGTNSTNTSSAGFGTNSSRKAPDELTDIDFDEFSDKALQKIDDFTGFLGIIASKETMPESVNQAIELAIELFVDENVLVEVSTKGFNETIKRKIRDYLNRLKLLQYDKVEIKWADINYVSNFRKGPDGNYYGSITVKQTFQGYKDNKVVYSDVTQKDVEIVIKGMEKSIQGQKEMVWDVLLSDIGVLDTK